MGGRPLSRVLSVLELLERRGTVGSPELADRFGVTARTVRRDIEQIRELGIGVDAIPGRHGGYRLVATDRLPPLLLSDDEAVALVLGIHTAVDRGVLAPEADRVAERVETLLPQATRQRVGTLRRQLAAHGDVGPRPVASRPVSSESALRLAEAIDLGRRVILRYEDRNGRRTDREVSPHGLVRHASHWYVRARDHLRDDDRTFRLDRVHAVLRTDRPADRPTTEPATSVRQALVTGSWAHRCEIVVAASATDVSRQLGSHVDVVDESDHGPGHARTRIVVGAEDLQAMARFVAWLPWPVLTVQPPGLDAAVAAHASALLDR